MIDSKVFWLFMAVIPAVACILVGFVNLISGKLEEKAKQRRLAENPPSEENSIAKQMEIIENGILRLKDVSRQVKIQSEEFITFSRQLQNETVRSYIR